MTRNFRTAAWARSAVALLLTTALIAAPAAFAAVNTFVEDFSTTTYRDQVSAGAEWSTTYQVLHASFYQPVEVGSYAGGINAMDVVVAGDLAYVVDYPDGLVILDVSDPTAPTLVGSYASPGNAGNVSLHGDFAFLADSAAGTQILDVSDPSAPVRVANYPTNSNVYEIAVAGNRAYIADNANGVVVIDITHPAAPVFEAMINTPGAARGVFVAGDMLYVSDRENGLLTFDISASMPVLLGQYDTMGLALKASVEGGLAVVADYGSGIAIIDVSDPANPDHKANYSFSGNVSWLARTGNLVFLADTVEGLAVVDVTTPHLPTTRLIAPLGATPNGLDVDGPYAFVGAADGLHVIQVRENIAPLEFAACDADTEALDIAVAGTTGYVLFSSVLDIIDLSVPAAPQLMQRLPLAWTATAMKIHGSTLFIVGDSGLMGIDISDPANPMVHGLTASGAPLWGLDIAGNLALTFAYSRNSGLRIFDISEPATPVLLGSVPLDENTTAIAVHGDHLLVGTTIFGLQIWDLTDPLAPVKLPYTATGTVASHPIREIPVGDLLFTGSDNYFEITDISDLEAPLSIGSILHGYDATDLAISGDRAYLATAAGLGIIDISDPTAPAWIQTPSGGPALDALVLHGDVLHSAARGPSDNFRSLAAFQDRVTQPLSWATSTVFATPAALTDAVSLQATQTAGMTWEVSADDGLNYQSVPNGGTVFLDHPGHALRWKGSLAFAQPGILPYADDVQVTWLSSEPIIASVVDVPNDQGRRVRVRWQASSRDLPGSPTPVLEYSVYRLLDAAAKAVDPDPAYPPGDWLFLTTVPADAELEYAVDVATAADSTAAAGIVLSSYFVRARTAAPGEVFDSAVVSGYSVDNLVPGAPAAFAVAYGPQVTLSWAESEDDDFRYFKIYRGDEPGFSVDPDNPVCTTAATDWVDPAGDWQSHYKISAVDFAGNESEVVGPSGLSPAGGLPAVTALLGNHPNPFNPATTIRFELAAPGAVTLRIYDVAGRLVRTLVDGERRGAGAQEVVWRGEDDAGQGAAAGVYYYRLQADGFSATRSLLLLK